MSSPTEHTVSLIINVTVVIHIGLSPTALTLYVMFNMRGYVQNFGLKGTGLYLVKPERVLYGDHRNPQPSPVLLNHTKWTYGYY